MREAIAIACAMLLGIYAGAMDASAFDMERTINNELRPIAIHINRVQTTTSSTQRQSILDKLTTAQTTTTNHYVSLSLEKLIKKIQTIIDSDIQSAPSLPVLRALADTYTK